MKNILYFIKYHKTLKYISERISELYNIPLKEAKKNVRTSWLIDILDDEEMVYEYIFHYDIDIICKMIMQNYFPGDKIDG